jgi:hypothetical protein
MRHYRGALGVMRFRGLVSVLPGGCRLEEVIRGGGSRLLIGDAEIAGIGAASFGPDGLYRMVPCAARANMTDVRLCAALARRCRLAMDLPMNGSRLAGTVVRRFGKQRGRDEKQDCKRQEGRKCSVQPHHVLRGAERQSNSYLRELLEIV